MMHNNIEVYVDDMIAKSKAEEDHLIDLREIFERLRKYDLKLNSKKCVFDTTSEKLLGFIVSQLGIEINPSKIKAITEIPAPRTEKEVRGFLGHINYIGGFVAKLTTKCEHLFKLLQKNEPMI